MGLLALTVALLMLWFNFHPVQTLSQISASSERVEFQVTQPRLAAFYVRGMRIGTSGNSDSSNTLNGKCVEGLLTPALETRVIYGRVGYGDLSIELLPRTLTANQAVVTGVFSRAPDNKDLSLRGRTYLEAEEECAHHRVLALGKNETEAQPQHPGPLPLWGRASIGAEFTGVQGPVPMPGLLLGGKLTVSAEAVSVGFLGLRPTLYSVAQLDLPVGSRVEASAMPSREEGSTSALAGRTEEVNWWGTVYVQNDTPALTVLVATDVPKLAVYRPNRHEPDVIEASLLTSLFEDPHLIGLYKLLSVFGAAWLTDKILKPRAKRALQ